MLVAIDAFAIRVMRETRVREVNNIITYIL